MPKRFTDTNKYRKKFFRSLPGAYKLLWDFLYHDCDNAGIWIVDFETAQIYVGKDMPIAYGEAEARFNNDEVRVIPFDNNKKWFIPSFITFQYGKLSEKNRAHVNVINILQKFNLLTDDLSPITELLKPLCQKAKGDKDMDKDMEMEKDKEKDKEKEKEEEKEKKPPIISMPFNGDFEIIWGEWKKYRREQHDFRYKSAGTEQAALHKLTSLSPLEPVCIAIIKQSMANGWKDFYPIKNNSNTSSHEQRATGSQVSTESLLRTINSMPDKDEHGAKK